MADDDVWTHGLIRGHSVSSHSAPRRRQVPNVPTAQPFHFTAQRKSSAVPQTSSPALALAPDHQTSAVPDYGIGDARDVLWPRPMPYDTSASSNEPPGTSWASLSLAFALLPAAAGLLFTNGNGVVTDLMLLGLAAIFLHWSVTQPWHWYHSAQQIRVLSQPGVEDLSDTVLDNAPDLQAVQARDNDGAGAEGTATRHVQDTPIAHPASHTPTLTSSEAASQAALTELYLHETLALASCAVLPLLSAYLLHAIRRQLSRPSESLVSSCNLTIFLLASELRVFSHLLKLVQSRTLHLQRIVHKSPFAGLTAPAHADHHARLSALEAAAAAVAASPLSLSQPADVSAFPARDLHPDLEALNRAVRRYEKKAAFFALETDARLLALDRRLEDTILLASEAVATAASPRRSGWRILHGIAHGFWVFVALPFNAVFALLLLPLNATLALLRPRLRRESSHGPSSAKHHFRTSRFAKQLAADRAFGRMSRK